MSDEPIRFQDGEAYDRSMGVWSRLAGRSFLDWLAPAPGLSWLDAGCGSGAFTELLMERCAPAEVQGVDPSEGQIAFARTRRGGGAATFRQGDAMDLPFEAGRFDAGAMALVLFFVPDPARGVAEMVRTVRPGGLIAAYVWDVPGDGVPISAIWTALRGMGAEPSLPPRWEVSAMPALRAAWTDAGIEAVETLEIAVARTFEDFESWWASSMMIGTLGERIAAMPAGRQEELKARTRALMPADDAGRIACRARANAVRGRRPGS